MEPSVGIESSLYRYRHTDMAKYRENKLVDKRTIQ